MKTFIKIFIIVLLVDILLGFTMSYIVGSDQPNFIFEIIDEIISFPISLWNRLVPNQGIYAKSTNVFWLVILFNALIQALVVFMLKKLLKRSKQ
ncbi:hypothetical protein [Winogradskyella schleiferi]|uniref:hypothetical protein n=1 Tax=Winogradskyella schleiferi TaxID=2686078 RepID=UPI0015BF7DA9|nr:hypothetical protein [Winogradskyella schleiferi]